MQVRSERRYGFDVDGDTFWCAIAETGEYRRWWPWLRRFEAIGLVEGDTWECVVQPPLPYTLQFTVTLDEVVPGRLARATIAGQLEGDARLEVETVDHGDACEVLLASRLAPTNGMLKAVAALARPLAQFGHDWVVDTGARQFRSRGLPSR